MTSDNIVDIAIKIKKQFKTNNPFKIADLLGIKFNYFPFKKDVIQAYILNPIESKSPCICINSNFNKKSQQIFCAHELGHAILHKGQCNHFDVDSISSFTEYEANLFAVALLFDTDSFCMDIRKMDNYMLKTILQFNVDYN